MDRLGIAAEVVFTEAPWHAVELAEAAVRGGAERIVAVGGDGTACEVAEGLHHAGGGTLAMLPVGTGNDVARSCGVPIPHQAALQVAAGNHTRRFDLIKVTRQCDDATPTDATPAQTGHVVINAIGIGLVGDINRRAARFKKIRGIAVYLGTALSSLFAYCSPEVRVETPQHSWHGAITMIAIQNGPTTGGGFKLTPSAVSDDGLLDATLVPGLSPLRRIPRLLAGMRGTLGQLPGTVELRDSYLELHHDEPIPMHLDGNHEMLEPPCNRFEVLPNALQVAVPAPPVRAGPQNA